MVCGHVGPAHGGKVLLCSFARRFVRAPLKSAGPCCATPSVDCAAAPKPSRDITADMGRRTAASGSIVRRRNRPHRPLRPLHTKVQSPQWLRGTRPADGQLVMRTIATANWRLTVRAYPLNCNSGTGADGADANSGVRPSGPSVRSRLAQAPGAGSHNQEKAFLKTRGAPGALRGSFDARSAVPSVATHVLLQAPFEPLRLGWG